MRLWGSLSSQGSVHQQEMNFRFPRWCDWCVGDVTGNGVLGFVYRDAFDDVPHEAVFCTDNCLTECVCRGCNRCVRDYNGSWSNWSCMDTQARRRCNMCTERAVLNKGQDLLRTFSTTASTLAELIKDVDRARRAQQWMAPTMYLEWTADGVKRWEAAGYEYARAFALEKVTVPTSEVPSIYDFFPNCIHEDLTPDDGQVAYDQWLQQV